MGNVQTSSKSNNNTMTGGYFNNNPNPGQTSRSGRPGILDVYSSPTSRGNSFYTNNYNPDSKVRLYSKDNFEGNVYEIDHGNYTSNMIIPKISPDNVYSLTIPPLTAVKLFCGDVYDYGGKGSMHITNVKNDRIRVPLLPEHVQGSVRSVSITKVENTGLVGGVIESSTSSLVKMSDINNSYYSTTGGQLKSNTSNASNNTDNFTTISTSPSRENLLNRQVRGGNDFVWDNYKRDLEPFQIDSTTNDILKADINNMLILIILCLILLLVLFIKSIN